MPVKKGSFGSVLHKQFRLGTGGAAIEGAHLCFANDNGMHTMMHQADCCQLPSPRIWMIIRQPICVPNSRELFGLARAKRWPHAPTASDCLSAAPVQASKPPCFSQMQMCTF